MLERLTARQIAEWMAYESVCGQLGGSWKDDVLADIHEQLQFLNRLTGAAHFTDKNHKKNPAAEPQRYPRPYEMGKPVDDDDNSSEAEGEDDEISEDDDEGE